MLPEEQLVRLMQQKRAGLWDLYNQQGNLGGATFNNSEDPLTVILGKDFNAKYRGEYADTLSDSVFGGGKGRLTSRTGARLLNDINEMTPRGMDALWGLSDNSDRALKLIKNINDARVGVNGYTQEAADTDFKYIADQLGIASRLRKTNDRALFEDIANRYVKGSLKNTIDSIKGAIKGTPTVAKGFVTDVTDEFNPSVDSKPAMPPIKAPASKDEVTVVQPESKVQSTSPTGYVDESSYSAKTDVLDHKATVNDNAPPSFLSRLMDTANTGFGQLSNFFKGDGKYLVPMLLLGAMKGTMNKVKGEGSFMWPLLLAAAFGGLYTAGRKSGKLGPDTSMLNTAIDKTTNYVNNSMLPGAYNFVKNTTAPAVDYARDALPKAYDNVRRFFTEPLPQPQSQVKFSNYNKLTIRDILS